MPRYFTPAPAEPKVESFLTEMELHAEAARLDEVMRLAGWGVKRHEPHVGLLTARTAPEEPLPTRLALRAVLAMAGWGTPVEAGLLTLPAAWVKALSRLAVRLPGNEGKPPPQLAQLGQWRGRLIVRFADEVQFPEGSPDDLRWRRRLQASLYPSAYRRLLPKDRAWLWHAHPELRPALTTPTVPDNLEF